MSASNMELKVQNLWESLSSTSSQRYIYAAEVASDLYSLCIEQITEAELAYSSSVLLHAQTGIVKFLQDIATIEEFSNCKEELLRLLHDYVKNLGKKILPYVISIKDVCISLFMRDKTAKVKNATFPLLINILELCGRSEYVDSLNIPKLAERYFQAVLQPTKHSATVRCGIYHLLGVLCEQFPEHMVSYSQRLVEIYIGTLKSEMVTKKGKKPELPVITGCLRGLTSYLHSFSQSASEGSVHAQDIYKYTRLSIDPKAGLTRYDVPRAGLLLIAKHAAQFREYLAKDSEHMYINLYSWCSHNNRECKLVGLQAMEAFFQEVSNEISECGDQNTNKLIYQEFMRRFRTLIDNPDTKHKELAVAIKGYGFFAKPCKIYGSIEDMHFMFTEMIQRSEQLFLAGLDISSIEEVLFQLPTFMEALASISKELKELPDGYLLSLKKLAILLFQYYPHIPLHIKYQSAVALLKLIMAVATLPSAFQQFLSHIVFQGLVRSCSLPVVIEAGDGSAVMSVDQAIAEESFSTKVASYVDYIELWTQLINSNKLKGLGLDYDTVELRQKIHHMIYNEFIQAILLILKKLDLSSSSSENVDIELESSGEADQPDTVTSDPIAGQQPTVPKDFQIFINLVELTRKILPFVAPSLFNPWALTFAREVIAMATQFPLVSGFYKLLAVCLTICKKTHYFKGLGSRDISTDNGAMEIDQETDRDTCFLLFRKFMKETVIRMQQYKDDLLASCLYMVLSLPSEMVQIDLTQLFQAIQQALKLGIGFLPLAQAVLDALEIWTQDLSVNQLKPLVTQIFPLLDDYLHLSTKTGSDKDNSGIISVSSSGSRGKRFTVKVLKQWKEGIEGSGNDIATVRKRILFLLGSLGGMVNASLVTDELSGHGQDVVAWDSQNKLEFPIPFSDMKPEIYLDPYLPHVCNLALSSSDRQTKVAACEFLHAILLFIVGKSAQQAVKKKSPMTKLYQRLFPVALQLACDVERVAEQLFRPLIFQLIHWFTRNTQYESPDTMALLEAILEGIEHPNNASLRDFSAQCVREFLLWSIKQTSKRQQERSPINIKSLLKRLYSMASHPSPTKRLGAALAFNNIYTVFREEDSLVDMFVMEMLVIMIKSLKLAHRDSSSLGTVEQCSQACSHLARIIKVKGSTLLSKSSKHRRVPRGLKSAEMSILVAWLLSQTGLLETEARRQCRMLFTMLAPSSSKVLNTRLWIRKTVESEGGLYFVSRFESCGHYGLQKSPVLSGSGAFSFMDTINWLESLQAALDNYNWVLGEQLISPSEVFNKSSTKSTDKISQLFTGIDFFLKKLALHGLEGTLACFSSTDPTLVFTSLEEEQYGITRSSVVQLLLDFGRILLVKHTTEATTSSFVPLSFWSDSLYEVLFAVLFNPAAVGVQPGDLVTANKLSENGVQLLQSMMIHFPTPFKNQLTTYISKKISSGQSHSLFGKLPIKLDETTTSRECTTLDRLVQGHVYLAEGGALLSILNILATNIDKLVEELFINVIDIVKLQFSEDGGNDLLSPAYKNTSQLMIKLALHLTEKIDTILNFVLAPKTGKKAGIGVMFYVAYSDVINMKLISKIDETLVVLLKHSNTSQQAVSTVLNNLLDFVQRDKRLRKDHSNDICTKLILHWSQLETWWKDASNTDLKLAAVTLLQKMFTSQPKLLLNLSEDSQHIQPVLNMYCQLLCDQQSSLNFKSKALEFLSSFLTLSSDCLTQLKSSLNHMIAHQFPLKSSELPFGSPVYNEYISVLDKLLNALVSSGSLLLLELVITIMCREKRHVYEEKLQLSLSQFITELSTTDAVMAINCAYTMFTNERSYIFSARRAIAERVCLPLIRECGQPSLQEFFSGRICEMMVILEAKLKSSESDLENQLVSKLCCFQFLEVLYSRLPSSALSSMESKVNSNYCKGDVKTGKELTQAITKCGHTAKSEDLHGDRTLYELRRQYHCYAYNMLVAVISCTQNKPQFFLGFLFKEDLSKGQYLWDNIIDSEKDYQFQIELEAPLKRKKQMMAIRDEFRENSPDKSSLGFSPPFPARYISSQYLADSSLSTDVSQYDFTFATTLSSSSAVVTTVNQSAINDQQDPKSSAYIVSEEHLEEDALNSHECMLPLMKLLDHMQHNKITPEVTDDSPSSEMPPWMAVIYKKMKEGATERNIRLFIAKLITNRPKIFQPYAKQWLPVLTQLIISGNHGGEGLHYFVVDIIVTMLSWATTAVLEDRYLASRLLEYTMNWSHNDNLSVFRNNLEVVRTLVECWKDHIQIPTKIIFGHFSNPDRTKRSNRTGVQLLGIVVANQLPAFDSATAGPLDDQKYYSTFIINMSNKHREVYVATAEVLGMLLAQMKESNHPFFSRLEELVTDQLFSLAQPSERTEDKFITCLHKLKIHYSRIVERFVDKLLFLLPTLQGVFRSLCLEVLQTQADIQSQFYLKLKDVGFINMLSHRDEATQLASLKIVQGMLIHLSNENLTQLLPILTNAFSNHISTQCRVTMYNVLMTIYNKLCDPALIEISDVDNTTQKLTCAVKDQLLVGLGDEADEIKLKMYEFWNQESNLISSTLGRLTQLLVTLYSRNTEQQFLYHSTNLLLELTSRSPDFNRSLFDTPLSECKFEDYGFIDLSWQQRHLQMTPLFAATQVSQSQSDFSSLGTGMLRATQQQSLAFTPTQEAGYSWMAPTAQSVDPSSASFTMGTISSTSDTSSLLFTRPSMRPPLKNPLRISAEKFSKEQVPETGSQDERRRQIMKLKKRFLKDKDITSSFFAKTEARKKIIREEQKKHRKAARQNYVVMYRKYRVGELPDIQIKYSEIIRPLQALAQNDSGLACLLFSSLYNAIFAEIDRQLTEQEADTTKSVLKENFNTVMECSSQFYSPFIGSLQDICFREPQLQLTPSVITTACLVSSQELIGIMLLEKQLISNVDQSSTKSVKRPRGASAKVSEATEIWVELARLYKSLEDYDVLRGIFCNLEGTQDITHKALEAEERGNYLEALQLYKKAMNTDVWKITPTQVEEDLWEDSLLKAYSHLTEWRDLEMAATLNIDDCTPPRLDKLWDDSYYQEHYLSYVLLSKLKLWCSDDNDHGLVAFLGNSLKSETSRSLLESRYPEQLTLAYILRNDFDRARYYLNLSLQSVLQDDQVNVEMVMKLVEIVRGRIDFSYYQNWSTRGDQRLQSSGYLQMLQRLTEISEFIDFMNSSSNFSSKDPLESLLIKWRKRYPDPKLDPIPLWDDIVTTRCTMLKKIADKLQKTSFTQSDSMDIDDTSGCTSAVNLDLMLSTEYTNMYMRIADAACVQNNYPVAKKYLHLVEKAIQKDFSEDQSLQLKWLHSITTMRLKQIQQDRSPSRIETMVSLASRLREFKSASIMASDRHLASKHHSLQGKTLMLLAEMFGTPEDGTVALSTLSPEAAQQLTTLTGDSSGKSTATQISKMLWVQSLSSLNTSINVGTARNPLSGKAEPTVESLVEMFTFCDKILHQEEEEDGIPTGLDNKQFPNIVINHTLTAMTLGSTRARELFPRLLQLIELYPDTLNLLVEKSSKVPCWMFIGWISQMVALLDKKEARGVWDILLCIADQYPQALYYPFNISSSGFKFESNSLGLKNREYVEKLKEKLRNHLMDDFVIALEQVNSPELVWKDFLDVEMKPLVESVSVNKRDKEAIKNVWEMMYNQLLDTRGSDQSSSLYGTPSIQKGAKMKKFAQDYLKKIEEKFGKGGSKIVSMSGTQYKSAVNEVFGIMRGNLKKQEGSALLKEYSPWLETFQQEDYSQSLEVPGQYDGKSKPLPEYHAKIAGFDSKLLVLSSLRKPKRLTIIGDDTKEYMFLVKGGEDLRLDQRIEQLFDVMNAILHEDAACSQRQLSLKTYAVIPMTPRVGLIEWIKKTKPLKDFMMNELTDTEMKNQTAIHMHQKWLKDKFGGEMNYSEMFKKANATEVEKEYRRKVVTIPWDLLRRAFIHLAANPEAFVILRSHFIKTLATVNICQYILGIGDRHLSNFMMDIETGGVIGIDFGHAFHSATQLLPIPELMPFRLTPQFINLLLPHKESGQLRSCMIHTLRALQASPTVLLNTMDVFIKEPSLEWELQAKKQALAQKTVNQVEGNDWFPKEKVKISKKKLEGYNSAHLMLIDLEHGFKAKPEFKSLKAILLGDSHVNLRARVGKQCDNVEEQVACLIDHATDSNILGRTWGGWEPWV